MHRPVNPCGFGPERVVSTLSSLHVSWSKYPRSYRMKLTRQILSRTSLMPTFCPAKTPLRLTYWPLTDSYSKHSRSCRFSPTDTNKHGFFHSLDPEQIFPDCLKRDFDPPIPNQSVAGNLLTIDPCQHAGTYMGIYETVMSRASSR
jgi:hypothetical protein